MTRDDRLAREAGKWLARAKSNLALARAPKPPDAVWEDLCFEAQQAAEKSVKAVLVRRDVDFPKTHNLSDLLSMVEGANVSFPVEFLSHAILLAPYAIEGRYPGELDTTEATFKAALASAEAIFSWAEGIISPAAGK